MEFDHWIAFGIVWVAWGMFARRREVRRATSRMAIGGTDLRVRWASLVDKLLSPLVWVTLAIGVAALVAALTFSVQDLVFGLLIVAFGFYIAVTMPTVDVSALGKRGRIGDSSTSATIRRTLALALITLGILATAGSVVQLF